MTPDTALASRLISSVELQDLRIRSCRAETAVRDPKEAGAIRFELQERATATLDEKEPTILASVVFAFRILRREERAAKPAVEIEAEYSIGYRLPKKLVPSNEELQAFAKVNATFNAWPFFRQHVHDVMGQMGLPAILIPVRRVARPQTPNAVEANKPKPRPRKEEST